MLRRGWRSAAKSATLSSPARGSWGQSDVRPGKRRGVERVGRSSGARGSCLRSGSQAARGRDLRLGCVGGDNRRRPAAVLRLSRILVADAIMELCGGAVLIMFSPSALHARGHRDDLEAFRPIGAWANLARRVVRCGGSSEGRRVVRRHRGPGGRSRARRPRRHSLVRIVTFGPRGS